MRARWLLFILIALQPSCVVSWTSGARSLRSVRFGGSRGATLPQVFVPRGRPWARVTCAPVSARTPAPPVHNVSLAEAVLGRSLLGKLAHLLGRATSLAARVSDHSANKWLVDAAAALLIGWFGFPRLESVLRAWLLSGTVSGRWADTTDIWGVFCPVVGILFATLISSTVDRLWSRQEALRRHLTDEAALLFALAQVGLIARRRRSSPGTIDRARCRRWVGRRLPRSEVGRRRWRAAGARPPAPRDNRVDSKSLSSIDLGLWLVL